MRAPEERFIERVASVVAQPSKNAPRGVRSSILAQAARMHGLRPLGDESTAPTGFDPAATALFEGTVEAAYLVAASDGPVNAVEKAVLKAIVGIGTDGKISPSEVAEMLEDIELSSARDGMEARVVHIAQTVLNRDHQREVLRIAAIMARASGGVRPAERSLLDQLASGFSVDATVVDELVAEAEEALERVELKA